MLESYDVPETAPHCPQRARSNVAPQALMMMNSRFVVEASQRFAERLQRERSGDLPAQLKLAWQLAYGIEPSESQLQRATAFVAAQTSEFEGRRDKEGPSPANLALASFCQSLLSSNRFLYIE